jgi:hypothetical protein
VFSLHADDFAMLNPNTGTCPIFLSQRDAEITLGVYRRHPVLIRDGDPKSNPWGIRFRTLFHMANDSGLFETADDMEQLGAKFNGWSWSKGEKRWLPLYEAKMLSLYNDRHGDYRNVRVTPGKEVRAIPTPDVRSLDEPGFDVMARYWVAESEITLAIRERWDRDWLFGWRDIATSLDVRTFVPSVLPRSAVGHVFPLVLPSQPERVPALQATWSSLAADYVTRQKLSGTHLSYGVLEQIACPAPSTFDEAPTWDKREPLNKWILPHVLELAYTSWRLQAYADDMGDDGPPFRWLPERRAQLRAEIDAAMFHIYGLNRSEVEHVLDSFPVVRKYEERDHGEFRTKRLILEIYDAMQEASYSGVPYSSRLEPPPGQGPRHPERKEQRRR